jgi:hypothetical protein
MWNDGNLASIASITQGEAAFPAPARPEERGEAAMTDYLHCYIRVKSHLSQPWADWFGGLIVQNLPNGEAVLFGDLPDYPALYGVVARMRDLGIEIASVEVNGVAPQPAIVPG